MNSWPAILVLLTGCSTLTAKNGDVAHPLSVHELATEAAEIERGCDLPTGSILHSTPNGDLVVLPVRPRELTFPTFSCVMKAVENARLEDRGVKVLLTGEDAP